MSLFNINHTQRERERERERDFNYFQPNSLQSSPLNSFLQLLVCVTWSSIRQNNLCREVAGARESDQIQVRILCIDKFVIKQILEGILGTETPKTSVLRKHDEFETSVLIKS